MLRARLTTTKVDFSLTCAGLQHADEGQTVTLALSGVTVPLDGAATATSTTIGPVPASWTDDTFGCPSPAPTLPANGQSTVTLRMPTTVGAGFIYTVMYSRVGANGLTGLTAISFEVDVVANTPPVLTLPGPITAEATSSAGTAVTYAASAIDAEDNPDPTPVCAPASGSTFALGTTTVSCSVTDGGGLSASGTFTVFIADTTSPALVLPGNLTAEATSAGGTSVGFATSASDVVDGSVAVDCDHASGDAFPLGTTTVSCTAADAAGNSTSGSFNVTVTDTTAPALGLPGNLTAEATGASGASVAFTTSASDAVDGTVSVDCDHASGDTFPLGTTTVTCSAADAAGNSTSGSFDVSVGDSTAPSLHGVPADFSVTTGNTAGRMVSYALPTATDGTDPSPSVGCGPASGSFFAVGPTTVTCTATDASGHSSSASFRVTVTYLAPPADDEYSVMWGAPVDGTPAGLVTNTNRTVPIKVRLFANGDELTTGSASLRVVACGGDTALVVPLTWGSARWNAHLDMSLLQAGCYVVIASHGSHDAGSFALEISGADAAAKPATATTPPTGKDKPKK